MCELSLLFSDILFFKIVYPKKSGGIVMGDVFFDLRLELEMTRKELEARLMRENHTLYTTEVSEELTFSKEEAEKGKLLIHHMREDLRDVKRALAKMDSGIFGICEATGVNIPIKQMRILPTAKTIYDFDLFQR